MISIFCISLLCSRVRLQLALSCFGFGEVYTPLSPNSVIVLSVQKTLVSLKAFIVALKVKTAVLKKYKGYVSKEKT